MRKVISIFILLLSSVVSATEFAVNPMMIDIEAKPNNIAEFDFSVIAKGNGKIKVTPYAMAQLETGHMGFEGMENNKESSAHWLRFEKNSYTLRKDQNQVVKGAIRIPSRAVGSHLAAVMVEEDLPPNSTKGVVVKVRYAVILNIKVVGRSKMSRTKTSFANVAFNKIDSGVQFEALFTNNSNFADWVYSEVQIRNEQRRLVARFPMKTESAWQRQDVGSRVYPNAKVRLMGLVKEQIEPGEYTIIVRNKFGKRTQPTFKQTIQVTEEDLESKQAVEEAATQEIAKTD